MALDLSKETLLTFSQASARVPGRPHIATLHRWRLRGVRGGIKLESCLIGGRRFTSVEALQRFANRLDPAESAMLVAAPPRTNKQRRTKADIVCKSAGL